MEKTTPIMDIILYRIFNLLWSLIVAYIVANFVFHHAIHDGLPLFISLKTLVIGSILVFNNNSGMFFNNPGADVLIYAVVAFIGSYCIVKYKFNNTYARSLNKSTIHGNSKFANEDDINKSKLFSNTGFLYGMFKNRLIIQKKITNTLLVGKIGSGKTAGPVICTLLNYEKGLYLKDNNAFSNAIIFEPKSGFDELGVDSEGKGTIYPQTAAWAKQNGVRTILYSLGESKYAKHNIFNEINLNDENWTAQLEELVEIIMDPSGQALKQDTFWINQGKALLSARVAYELIKNKDKPKNKTTLYKIAYMFADYDIENEREYSMADSFKDMQKCSDPYVRSAGYRYNSTVAATLSGFLANTQEGLRIYRDKVLGDITSDSTFSFNDLLYRQDENGNPIPPTWLYFVVPTNSLNRLQPYNQLFFNFFLNKASAKTDTNLIKKYPVKVILDEFTLLGKLEELGRYMGIVREAGISFVLVTQTLNNITNTYGKDNSVMSNCDDWVIYGVTGSDEADANALAKRTGPVTAQETKTTIQNKGGMQWRLNRSISKSVETKARTLLTEHDIIKMPEDKCLILSGNCNAIYADKVLYFKNKEFKRRAELPVPISDFITPEMLNKKSNFISEDTDQFQEI